MGSTVPIGEAGKVRRASLIAYTTPDIPKIRVGGVRDTTPRPIPKVSAALPARSLFSNVVVSLGKRLNATEPSRPPLGGLHLRVGLRSTPVCPLESQALHQRFA